MASVPEPGGVGQLTAARLRWLVEPDAAAVARVAADRIAAAAATAISDHQRFRVVLAGGRTPQAVYRLLARSPQDWSHWEIYFGDERCLPPDHPDRNSRMARDAWLGRISPKPVVHVIPAELGPEAAADAYSSLVERAAPFDLVLLGVGEDGHTASLFPSHPLDAQAWTVAVHDAPKPPPQRVSLGLRALRSTREVLVMATGPGKHSVLQRWRDGVDLPVARVCAGLAGAVLTDLAAR